MDDLSTRKPRTSLTKSQLEDPVALDLLQLLQTITSDGRLLEAEIQALHEWLRDHGNSPLPGLQYLSQSVETVIADGRISLEERRWLQKAVETVLPKQQRDLAAMRRREAAEDDRKKDSEQRAKEAELERKRQPIATFDFMVAGVLYEGRADIVVRHLSESAKVFLAREPTNQYSLNAIAVRLINGYEIGYVPETEASLLAPLLDQGGIQSAAVKKILQGRRAPIPVIWGELYASDSPVQEGIRLTDIPPRRSPTIEHQIPSGRSQTPIRQPEQSRTGCLGLVIIFLSGLLFLYAAIY